MLHIERYNAGINSGGEVLSEYGIFQTKSNGGVNQVGSDDG